MTIYLMILGICLFIMGMIALVFGVGNLIHFHLVKKRVKPLEDGEKVSVVIPARNEEANLPQLLESFTRQTYRNYEVIVIDDASTDRTWEIIESYMKRDSRIHGYKTDPDRKLAKSGKINALLQAIEHATGDYLYCTDADTIHNPDAISFGYAIMKKKDLDIISGFPTERCKSFIGSISMSSMLLSFIYVPHFLARFHSMPLFTVAIGQFIMMKRKSYDEIGGYTAVGTQTCDDMAIAKHFVRCGKKYHLVPISDHVTCNMYTARKDAFYGIARSIGALITTQWYVLLLIALILLAFLQIVISPIMILIPALWQMDMTAMILMTIGIVVINVVWGLCALEMGYPLKVACSCIAAFWQIGHMYLYGLILKIKGKKFIWKGRAVD